MLRRLVLLAMCLTLIPGVSARADAQTSAGVVEPDVPKKVGKNLRALRVDASEAPRVDGRLDDQAWVKADRIDDFARVEPNNRRRWSVMARLLQCGRENRQTKWPPIHFLMS